MAKPDEGGPRQPIASPPWREPKSAIVTTSAERFITSEAEDPDREPAVRLNRMTLDGTNRQREVALLYFPAVQQTRGNPGNRWQAEPERRAARPEHRKRRGSLTYPFQAEQSSCSTDLARGQAFLEGDADASACEDVVVSAAVTSTTLTCGKARCRRPFPARLDVLPLTGLPKAFPRTVPGTEFEYLQEVQRLAAP